jgi:hypothetical protein
MEPVDVVTRFLATCSPLWYGVAIGGVLVAIGIVVLCRDDLLEQRRQAERDAAAAASDAERRRQRFAALSARQDFDAWARELTS